MAIIRAKDAAKLSHHELDAKINELKLELIKSNVTAQKTKGKTKEIKRTLARLYTIKSNSPKTVKEVKK